MLPMPILLKIATWPRHTHIILPLTSSIEMGKIPRQFPRFRGAGRIQLEVSWRSRPWSGARTTAADPGANGLSFNGTFDVSVFLEIEH